MLSLNFKLTKKDKTVLKTKVNLLQVSKKYLRLIFVKHCNVNLYVKNI